MSNIYRYKFSSEITELISNFSKLHQFDHRNDFKEAWEVFYNSNIEIINQEKERLYNLNYKGDIDDKLFKSARYYFRNKALIGSNASIEKTIIEPRVDKKKRDYITLTIILLDLMDEDIKSNINNPDFTPANAYSNFCNTFSQEIKREIQILIVEYVDISNEDICKKIKKAYKNRYYQYITHY